MHGSRNLNRIRSDIMARLGEVNFDIGLTVTDETAAACCVLMSLYFTNNPDKHLMCKVDIEGEERKIRYYIQEEEDGEKI